MAAALVLASLQAERLRAVGASVPTLALPVVTYSLGVVAVAPVHLGAGNHRRLGANALIGVGVLLFVWATVGGPDVASLVGLLALLAAGILLYLEGDTEEDAATDRERDTEADAEA